MAQYTGFAFPFQKNETGFPAVSTDDVLIKQSILQILLTGVGERCLVGDTKIPLLDGTSKNIADLVEDGIFWVYSCDPATGEVVPGKARASKTGEIDRFVEIELDSGAIVRCTPEHRWLLRDGGYVPASELTPGTSLMPLYRSISDAAQPVGYEQVRAGTSRMRFTHQIVAQYFHLTDNTKRIAHHRNGNKLDNRPQNLMGVTGPQHRQIHRELAARMNAPEVKERAIATHRRRWKEDEVWAAKERQRLSELRTKTNNRPDERARIAAGAAEMGRRFWSDPAYAEARVRNQEASQKARAADFALGEDSKIRQATRRRWQSDRPEDVESTYRTIAAATATFARINADGTAMRQRCRKAIGQFKSDLGANADLSEVSWDQWRATLPRKGAGVPRRQKLSKLVPEEVAKNHSVTRVSRIDLEHPVEVFDLYVEDFHNFALEAGVFVHNCMRPTFGSNVYRFIFEPNDTPLEALIQTEIKDALSKWEPRVALQNVTVVRGDPTQGEDLALITVTVFYVVLLSQNTGTAVLTFNGP